MSEQLPQPSLEQQHVITAFQAVLRQRLGQGAITFSEYMDTVLNKPGYGYYRRDVSPISAELTSGDFTTASELTYLYGATLANDFALVLQQCSEATILELGAGSGAFAYACLQQLQVLNSLPEKYLILETSAARIAEQKQKLLPVANELKVTIIWLNALPTAPINGVIIANEILDVLPVEIFRVTEQGFEMLYVTSAPELQDKWCQPTAQMFKALQALQQKLGGKLPVGMQSEICLCLPSWLHSISASLATGLLFFADYGYERDVYYHAQRTSGTLHCHFKHHMHANPYLYPGQQDITAHVDFSEVGDVLTDAGLECCGLLTQAQYLLQAGILQLLDHTAADIYMQQAQRVKKLLHPNYMGEVFKIMAFGKDLELDLPGLA